MDALCCDGFDNLSPPPLYSSAIGNFVIGLSPIEHGPPVPERPKRGLPCEMLRLYDTVQASLPGLTMPVIDLELWNTVQEFCFRAAYFRELVQWRMAPGVTSVDLNPFNSWMEVAWVLEQNGLTDYKVNPPGQLVDYTTPQYARSGAAWVALRPNSFSVLIDNRLPELFTAWFEVMLDGLLFRLYGMPAKPWSSPQLAQYHGTRFRQGMNRARDIAERMHTREQSSRRAFPYFARGRRKN